MIAKITEQGHLNIKRAGKWTVQHCPFARPHAQEDAPVHCGIWCPLLDEIEESILYEDMADPINTTVAVNLKCGNGANINIQMDERKL